MIEIHVRVNKLVRLKLASSGTTNMRLSDVLGWSWNDLDRMLLDASEPFLDALGHSREDVLPQLDATVFATSRPPVYIQLMVPDLKPDQQVPDFYDDWFKVLRRVIQDFVRSDPAGYTPPKVAFGRNLTPLFVEHAYTPAHA